MREEKEEQRERERERKKKRNKNKVYRNICRMKFYRWFSLRGRKKPGTNGPERKIRTAFSFYLSLSFSIPLLHHRPDPLFFGFPQTNEFISAGNRIVWNLLIRG